MDQEELKKKIEEYKAQGMSEEEILEMFSDAFDNGEIEPDDLKFIVGTMGYEFTPEFEAKIGEFSGGEAEDTEDLTAEDVEDLKEIGEDEDADDFKEKIEDANAKKEDDFEEDDEDEEVEDEDDEEDEKEQAMKLFGLRD